MQKVMFNERYGLQSAVFEGRKTQTRREPFFSNVEIETHYDIETGKFFVIEKDTRKLIHTSRYAIGEIVAVAQSYKDAGVKPYRVFASIDEFMLHKSKEYESKGWNNKMFVRADLMPQHIRITNIRCERLQDISNEDCLKEGVFLSAKGYYHIGNCETKFYYAEQSFKYIIGKLNGKKFWDTNPYVIVYEFELVD